MQCRVAAALAVCVLAQASVMKYELYPYDSVAEVAATVVAGKARFTVLADGLLRMEYSESGAFEDRPTLAVVNRKTPVPQFTQSNVGGTVTITTARAKLTYTAGSGDFKTASVFKVEPVGSSTFTTWTYGQTSATDKGNLRGTVRTLDEHVNGTVNCNRYLPDGHCVWGLVSRIGWALIEETDAPCMDGDDWWTDDSGKMLKNADTEDLYLLAYSHDYMTALRDYTQIGGHIPIFPRNNHGVWFTRWYDFANKDVREIVGEYEDNGMPLDVMVLDMNWHKKDDWSGYSWDPNLYQVPQDTMDYFHQKGLLVAANLHDAHGIGKWEDKYLEACTALGLDPSNPGGPKGIPLSLVNKSYVNVLEDIVVQPIEEDGMDFWWIDWQQSTFYGGAGQDKALKMNPTIWTDKMRVTDSKRRCVQNGKCTNKRGVVHARWGGLGNHRYQHGFSGDVLALTWFNLAFQTYFTATAVNVGWGYWSHDIMGPGDDHEMFTRWIQLGSVSGIMRSHDRGLSAGKCKQWPTATTDCSNVRPYNVPRAYEDINRAALRLRTGLVPYIYTHTKKAFESGVGLIRPMYYHYPSEAMAYPVSMDKDLGQEPTTRQYMFGEDILAAPVTSSAGCTSTRMPLEEPCGVTPQKVWLPPGSWVEWHSGRSYTGPQLMDKKFANWEIPLYVRAGAIITTIPISTGNSIGRAADPYNVLEFSVFPGATSGKAAVYEDDGGTYDYLQGKSGWVNAAYTRSGTQMLFSTNTTGTFPGQPSSRAAVLKIVNSMPPTSVKVGGQAYAFSRWGGVGTWSYDGESMTVRVEGRPAPVTTTVVFQVDFAGGSTPDLSGFKGKMRRGHFAKRNLDETRVTPGSTDVDPNGSPMLRVGSMADTFSYTAGKDIARFQSLVGSFNALFANATAEAAKQPDLLRNSCKESHDTGASRPVRSPSYPFGLTADKEKCCKTCSDDKDCRVWMHITSSNTCFPLADSGPPLEHTPGVVLGTNTDFTRATYSLDLLQSA